MMNNLSLLLAFTILCQVQARYVYQNVGAGNCADSAGLPIPYYSINSVNAIGEDPCKARCDGDLACSGYTYQGSTCSNYYVLSRLTVFTDWTVGPTTEFESLHDEILSTTGSNGVCMKKLNYLIVGFGVCTDQNNNILPQAYIDGSIGDDECIERCDADPSCLGWRYTGLVCFNYFGKTTLTVYSDWSSIQQPRHDVDGLINSDGGQGTCNKKSGYQLMGKGVCADSTGESLPTARIQGGVGVDACRERCNADSACLGYRYITSLCYNNFAQDALTVYTDWDQVGAVTTTADGVFGTKHYTSVCLKKISFPTPVPTRVPTYNPTFMPTHQPTMSPESPCVVEQDAIHVTDSTSDGRQWYPIVEKLTDNRLVVAWDDLGTNDNMFRVYGSDLAPLTAATAFGRNLTMQGSWGWQARESVRALPSGGFIMVVSGAEIGAQYANGRFEIKIFDASLTVTHTSVFGAHLWGEPQRSLMEPKIVLLTQGFMVTFRISHCGLTWSCHAAQIFDATANPVGDWFYVDGRVRGGDERSAALLDMPEGPWSGHVRTSVALPNGNVLLVHSGMNAATAGTTSASIWNDRLLVKAHFLLPDVVATRAAQSDHYAHAALLSNGNVVVAWTRYQRENADGTGRDQRQLLFQILDQDGNKVGSNHQSWGPMESSGDASLTVGGYVMVAATEGKFTISSHSPYANYNVFTRTFLNDGTPDGAIVNEMESLEVSFASRAVIEYSSDNYVIAVQGSRIDNIMDAQDGIFLIGKPACIPETTSPETTTATLTVVPTLMPSANPTLNPTLMPTANPTSVPTANPTDMDVFVADGDACPANAEHLTHVDCRQAAEQLGIYYWGSNPAAPSGCWKYVNPVNGATYAFGNVNDGTNIQPNDISPICRTTPVSSPVCALLGTSSEFKFTFTRSCQNGWSSTCADGFALYGLYGEKLDIASLNPVITDTGFWRSGAHSYVGAEIQEGVGLAYCSEPLRCQHDANLEPEVVTITLDRPVSFSSFDFQQVDKLSYRPIDFTLDIMNANGAYETVANAPFDLGNREIRNFGNECNIPCDMLAYGSELKFTFTRTCVNDWSSTCVDGFALYDLLGEKMDLALLSPTVTDTGFWRSGAHSYIGAEIQEGVGLTYCAEPIQCQSGVAMDDEIVTITFNQPVAFSSFDLQQADKLWYRPSDFTLEVRNANGAFGPVFNAPFDLGNREIRNFGNQCTTESPTMQPTTMPTSEPTPVPSPPTCEKQGQCVNSNGGAVFATMTARHLMTKAECIAAFDSCADAAGGSFRSSTNTCQIFGDGAMPSCAAVSGWQPGNVLDQSTGPVTSTTGSAAPWADVTCFSPDLCAPPVCEMRGQCVNSNHNAIFATMTGQSMTKEECTAAFQACGDAAAASWRSSTSTCQIFGDGALPTCATVGGMQPGNVGDRSTGPVTSTTGNAAPWADVVCFSENLCDSVVRMRLDVEGWSQTDFTANKDVFTATLASSLGLTPPQVQVSLRRLGWLRRNLGQGLSIYVRVKAQDTDMASINAQLANPSTLTSDLEAQFPSAQFTLVSSEVKSVQEAQSAIVTCPTGSVQRTGYSSDGSWTTYTDTIEDCKQACDLQTPNHGNLPARPCNAFMWSPTVRAGTKGQCWRYENAAPEFSTSLGDYTYCERTDVAGQIMDSGAECGAGSAITTEAECKQYAASLGIGFSWVGIVHAPGGCFWHHNTGMSGSRITNIGFNSDLTDNGSGWGGVGRVCKETDVFVASGDSCPAQSEHLTHVDCREAAAKLGLHYWGSNPAAPRGCWKYVNPVNGATYAFGNVNDGTNIQPADISPICKTTNEPSNALTLLGAGRCKSNGNIVPLGGYVLQTPKDKCLADCEVDASCVAAMPAYNYYCQHFMKSDVSIVDDFAANYQTQWECYAKSNPDKIVTMRMKAQGMTSAQFHAQERDLAASLASSLGVPAGQVELSLTPFQRRALNTDDDGLEIFARIRAREAEMEAINQKASDPNALARELSENNEGVTFEVKSTDVQAFELNESPNTDQEVITETKTEGVSLEVFVVAILVCLMVGLGFGMAIFAWSTKSIESADADPEMGEKRLPGLNSQPELKKEISLQNVVDVQSSSLGGTTLQEGESKELYR